MEENRKLRILILPAWYPSEKDPVEGVFVRVHAKAVYLYNDVIILYSEGAGKDVKGLYKTVSDKIEDAIRTIRIKYKKSPIIPKASYFIYLWSIFAAFRKLLKEGWRPDILHAHVFTAGMPAVLIGKWYHIPVIITEHWSRFPRYQLGPFARFMARFVFTQADRVCPVSEKLKQCIIEAYSIRARFRVVPNPVDTALFYYAPEPKRDGKKHILFVGSLIPIKGLPYLLKALSPIKSRRNDFVLDIVGDGANRAEYEMLAEQLGLYGLVRFHGAKGSKEVAEFMRQADLFVLPSLFETFSVVAAEALTTGTPVLATYCGGPEEFVTNEVGFLVASKDAEALRKGLDYMLEHLEIYLPDKISHYAMERFSPERVGIQFYTIYKTVLTAKSAQYGAAP